MEIPVFIAKVMLPLRKHSHALTLAKSFLQSFEFLEITKGEKILCHEW